MFTLVMLLHQVFRIQSEYSTLYIGFNLNTCHDDVIVLENKFILEYYNFGLLSVLRRPKLQYSEINCSFSSTMTFMYLSGYQCTKFCNKVIQMVLQYCILICIVQMAPHAIAKDAANLFRKKNSIPQYCRNTSKLHPVFTTMAVRYNGSATKQHIAITKLILLMKLLQTTSAMSVLTIFYEIMFIVVAW